MAVELGDDRSPASGAEGSTSPACVAPGLQLHLKPNGDVAACCRSEPYGNVGTTSLHELWESTARRRLQAQLRRGFPDGCAPCEGEVAIHGPALAYPAQFVHWSSVVGGPDPRWPRRIEFNLSNTCNLQCVQCNGELSSSIRVHREKRSPLARVYDDAFFDDLVPFLPHLRSASFAGGEPFLAAESLHAMELAAQHGVDLRSTVVTNGTQWNDRVERIMDRLRPDVIVSIDAVDAETYARLRVGGDLPRVVSNLDRFLAAARAFGGSLSLNHCLMPDNVSGFPELLRFAEHRGIVVNPIIVLGPGHASLAHLPRPDLEALLAPLHAAAATLEAELALNAPALRTVLARLADLSGDETGTRTAWTDASSVILQFPRRRRDGRVAGAPSAADGSEPDPDGSVHVVVVGADERTGRWPTALTDVLALEPGALDGAPMSALLAHVDRFEPRPTAPDGFDADLSVGDVRLHLALRPRRDADGWCDEVEARFAVVRAESTTR